MKKNNTYLVKDEIDLRDLIKKLRKEKILILSISIICGLLSYYYAFLKPQEFETQIILKDPPPQLFEPYNSFMLNKNDKSIFQQFIHDYKLSLLYSDNLESFLEESREFDNFKGYLKSRNISAKKYFFNTISVANEKNIITSNKYLLNHSKELDGAIFLDNYVEFIRKKNIFDLKNNLKLALQNSINENLEALEIAKKIQLEDPIAKINQFNVVTNEKKDLFYYGTKVLSENILYLNKKLVKLENNNFDYNIILQKSTTVPHNKINFLLYFAIGLISGLFLSLGIIFLRSILKNN
jgi:LPS O-antigen subunit length determinant protein (WzzB/FepE family)